MTPNV